MPADLILYAVVAAGLVFWLRSILGTRHGDERERPNPYTASENSASDPVRSPTFEPSGLVSNEDKIVELSVNPTNQVSVGNRMAEEGLLGISRVDRAFDIEQFIDGAQNAFVIIVEAFAQGDRDTLRNLLSESVYRAFEGAIEERARRGETVSTEIHAIRRTEIIEASLRERAAYITIRFTADETCVIRDRDGEILSGNPDRITEMVDVWVFSRELRARDPRWFLVETREDAIEEHKTPLPEAGGIE